MSSLADHGACLFLTKFGERNTHPVKIIVKLKYRGVIAWLVPATVFKTVERLGSKPLVGSIPIHSRNFQVVPRLTLSIPIAGVCFSNQTLLYISPEYFHIRPPITCSVVAINL